ncbi:serine hydrolase [Bacilliculturomica massiliensis]|uniref:serine hydrolase n=1 Tax=Bacilliculturomica massiliensis TaxID=1917867 RepID=UPI0013EF3DA6|nr:serine hydrolase [Bacilliculturomica massiliensis]
MGKKTGKRSPKARVAAALTAVLLLSQASLTQAAAAETATADPADSGAGMIESFLGAPKTAEEKAGLIVSQYGAVSLQYAVIEDGKITTSGHSGVYSKSENRALTSDVMYGIGSVSKMFTTVVVMKLAEEGKIELDRPLTDYVKEFRMEDERYRDITVRMLLNHSSGLMGSSYKNAFLFGDTDAYAHDTLLEQLRVQRLKADPGAFSTYCNDGFTLAEIAAERVTGKSFTELVREYITGPLSMESTKTPQDSFDRDRLAKIYWKDFEKELPEDTVGIIGTGGIYSTAEDMCRFAQIFMRGDGQTAPVKILSPVSVEAMEQKEFARGMWPDKESPEADGFGLGWDSVNGQAFSQSSIREVTKGGDTFFYHASLVVLPEKNMAAAVLSSGGSSLYDQLLAETLLQERLEAAGEASGAAAGGSAGGAAQRSSDEEKTSESPQETAGEPTDGAEQGSESLPAAMPAELLENQGFYGTRGGVMNVRISGDGALSITVPGNEEYEEKYTYAAGSAGTGEGAYFTDAHHLVQISFVKESNGEVYIKVEGPSIFPGLGVVNSAAYTAQKLPEREADKKAAAAWEKRNGKRYYVADEKYTSSIYLTAAPLYEFQTVEELPGYVLSMAVGGPDDIRAAVQIPGSAGRDLGDYHVETVNGVEYISGFGGVAVGEEALLPVDGESPDAEDGVETGSEAAASAPASTPASASTPAPASASKPEDGLRTYEIGEKGYSVWLSAGQAAGRSVTVTLPERGAFFVYDGDGVCVASSVVSDSGTAVLPEDGTVCLAGDPGQKFTVELSPYDDVTPDDWYGQAVLQMKKKGLMAGTAAHHFSPEETMTRAMMVTLLHKLNVSEPEKYGIRAERPALFADVDEGQWYAEAAAWAGGAGIVSGVETKEQGEALFGPEEPVTREQLALMLCRYTEKLGMETPSEGMAIREFEDGDQISSWAQEALRWAVESGLLSGKPAADGGMLLDPQGEATRAETAVIIDKWLKMTEDTGRGAE